MHRNPQITVVVPDRVPTDVPKEHEQIYLEGLRAGRLAQHSQRFKTEIYTARRQVEMTKGFSGLACFQAQQKLKKLQIQRDIFMQGWRTGQQEREYTLKGGL